MLSKAVTIVAVVATGAFALLDYGNVSPGDYSHEVERDLVYGKGTMMTSGVGGRIALDTVDLLLDAYIPSTPDGEKRAAVVLLHGGAFTSGSKDEMQSTAEYLSSLGFAAFSIDYRLLNPPSTIPNAFLDEEQKARVLSVILKQMLGQGITLEEMLVVQSVGVAAAAIDARAAVRWIRANAETYGVDPECVYLWGYSAGAIGALFAGTSAPDAALADDPSWPVSNSPGYSSDAGAVVSASGAMYGEETEMVDARDPPLLLWHGMDDATVPFEHARSLKEQCDVVGIHCETHFFEGVGHDSFTQTVDGKDLNTIGFEFILTRGIQQQTAIWGPGYPGAAPGGAFSRLTSGTAISVYTVQGKLLWKNRYFLQQGLTLTQVLYGSQLPAGVYLVSLRHRDQECFRTVRLTRF